jgi:UDP-N-acetylmuramyl pentapeptide synthase
MARRPFYRRIGDRLYLAYEQTVIHYWRYRALRNRARYCPQLILVTGSCGKSTTTLLATALLGAQVKALGGLFNNTERWAYKTLRRMTERVDVVVQEASEHPPGTLGRLATYLRPEGAIITSVGLDHITEFRNEEAVAAEMVPLVQDAAIVALNADDTRALGLASFAKGRVVSFGTNPNADVRAVDISSGLPGGLRFTLAIGARRWSVRTRFIGTLMLTNVLGALAIVHATGRDVTSAVETLADTEPALARFTFTGLPGHEGMLIDSIKAPFWSALRLADDLPNLNARRLVFVLGPLSDTGNGGSGRAYRRVLRAAAATADLVVGLGPAAAAIGRLRDEKLKGELIAAWTIDDAIDVCRSQPASLFVVKGNRLNGEVSQLIAALGGALPFPLRD